jgi:hypothetical protein
MDSELKNIMLWKVRAIDPAAETSVGFWCHTGRDAQLKAQELGLEGYIDIEVDMPLAYAS